MDHILILPAAIKVSEEIKAFPIVQYSSQKRHPSRGYLSNGHGPCAGSGYPLTPSLSNPSLLNICPCPRDAIPVFKMLFKKIPCRQPLPPPSVPRLP